MSKNNIENIFKNGFDGEDAPYQPGDWDKMQQLLNQAAPAPQPASKNRRKLLWSLAALLLISGAAWIALTPSVKKQAGQAHTAQGRPVAANSGGAAATTATAAGHGGGNAGTAPAADTLYAPPAAAENSAGTTPPAKTGDKGYNQVGETFVAGGDLNQQAAGQTPPRTMRDKAGLTGKTTIPGTRIYNKKNGTAISRHEAGEKDGGPNGNRLPAAVASAWPPPQPYTGDEQTAGFAEKLNAVTTVKKNITAAGHAGQQADTVRRVETDSMTSMVAITPNIRLVPDTLHTSTIKPQQGAKKDKKAKGFGRKVLGLPQWVSAGYTFTPIASGNYTIQPSPQGNTYPFLFYLAGDSLRLLPFTSKGFHIALGSEWYGFKNKQQSLNTYVMLQYAPARHISQSTRIDYGTGFKQYDTIADIKSLVALRLGADYIHHSGNGKLQWGGGINVQYLAMGRGEINYYENYPGGGISNTGIRLNGLFNGLRRWNIGLSANFNYSLTRRIMVDARAGYDFFDMTKDDYYQAKQRNNLSYISLGLKLRLHKGD